MSSYTSNLKSWGSKGSEYPDGYSYKEGDQPVDVWDNFLTDNLISDIKHLISTTNSRIESDKGGSGDQPSSPESSHLYGNTDDGRLRFWDSGDSAWHDLMHRDGDTMTGVLDMGGYAIKDTTGILTLSGSVDATGTLKYGGNEVATQNWVNNNADVPNANHADTAGDADTVDGIEAADLGNSDSEIRETIANGDGVPHPTYASKNDVPALSKGETVFIDGDGLYVEDGT